MRITLIKLVLLFPQFFTQNPRKTWNSYFPFYLQWQNQFKRNTNIYFTIRSINLIHMWIILSICGFNIGSASFSKQDPISIRLPIVPYRAFRPKGTSAQEIFKGLKFCWFILMIILKSMIVKLPFWVYPTSTTSLSINKFIYLLNISIWGT